MQIPREWRDESLRAAFAPFGNVLSTRVFIDKVISTIYTANIMCWIRFFFRQMTGASKCFGFVSYDNADSAKNAINTMNGFAVGGRQLQVIFFLCFFFVFFLLCFNFLLYITKMLNWICIARCRWNERIVDQSLLARPSQFSNASNTN